MSSFLMRLALCHRHFKQQGDKPSCTMCSANRELKDERVQVPTTSLSLKDSVFRQQQCKPVQTQLRLPFVKRRIATPLKIFVSGLQECKY